MAENVEIERKYLLRGLPPEVQRLAPEPRFIDQFWTPGKQVSVRFREVGNPREPENPTFYQTMKVGQGLVRQEFEEEIDVAHYTAMDIVAQQYNWPRIVKTRYAVPEGDLTWEIDVIEFQDKALVLAEVELPSAEHAVTLPSWLAPHVVREVTEERAYNNYELAVKGLPRVTLLKCELCGHEGAEGTDILVDSAHGDTYKCVDREACQERRTLAFINKMPEPHRTRLLEAQKERKAAKATSAQERLERIEDHCDARPSNSPPPEWWNQLYELFDDEENKT